MALKRKKQYEQQIERLLGAQVIYCPLYSLFCVVIINHTLAIVLNIIANYIYIDDFRIPTYGHRGGKCKP
jgi:hypothetical protein